MPIHPLFHHLIDYAGVFPPANLTVGEAARRYTAAAAGPLGWMLGPFLGRASQLSELVGIDAVGLIVDVDPAHIDLLDIDLAQAERRVDPANPDLSTLVALAPVVYVESSSRDALSVMPAVGEARDTGFDVRAKIRMGGDSADAFPSPATVATFIRTCNALGVPFKATAGLHHPFRRASTITGAMEHGFVNLISAVRAAVAGGHDRLETILLEENPSAFDAATCAWQGVGSEVPASAIRNVLSSIGSCSFDEPVGYLRALGVLDVPA